MTIAELMKKYSDTASGPIQMVLKFSNNNDRLICAADMDANSKFIRASKRRLAEDFLFDGVIQKDGAIIHGSEDLISDETVGCVYRTRTCKNDYFLYVSEDFKLLESVRRRSYSSIKKESNRQLTLNSVAEPNKSRELSIVAGYSGADYWFCMSSPLFTVKEFKSPMQKNDTGYDYVGQYMGIILALKTALRYMDKLDVIKIYRDSSLKYSDGVFKLPLKKWSPFNKCCAQYVNEITSLKDRFQSGGVSLCFRV